MSIDNTVDNTDRNAALVAILIEAFNGYEFRSEADLATAFSGTIGNIPLSPSFDRYSTDLSDEQINNMTGLELLQHNLAQGKKVIARSLKAIGIGESITRTVHSHYFQDNLSAEGRLNFIVDQQYLKETGLSEMPGLHITDFSKYPNGSEIKDWVLISFDVNHISDEDFRALARKMLECAQYHVERLHQESLTQLQNAGATLQGYLDATPQPTATDVDLQASAAHGLPKQRRN